MRKIIISAIIAIMLLSSALAHERDFTAAESIIENKTACNNLTDEQLEVLGDYFMEQMHPGELHEIMDERMGGEGSEQLGQVHINMGKIFYCGESTAINQMMMNSIMGRTSFMSRMMYGNYYQQPFYFPILQFFALMLFIAVLILLIILLIKKLQKK